MGKTMEKMANDRLAYWVESKGRLQWYQSGFRRGRGTMDPVVCLEDAIRKAQVNRETVVAVFFDIEKAYDMMWTEGLLIKLNKIGVRGRMYRWISAFLSERTLRVRIDGELSESFRAENGTPQGSIVSPLFFAIMIDQIFKDLQEPDGVALFADDGAMWKKGRNLEFIVNKMQGAVNKVQQWTVQWGFRISIEKTKVMFFTRKKISQEFKIMVSGKELERVEIFKYLGVWFDKRLTWAHHIQKMIDKCKRILNVMRCLCGVDWGATRSALKTIYTGLMRSVMDYGCISYGSASKTSLSKLDGMHSQAIRIISGAMKSSPVAAIQVEVGEMPLHLRRDQLALVYWANVRGHKENHMSQTVLRECQERGSKKVKSYGWTIREKVNNMGIGFLNISPTVAYPVVPPWILEDLKVDLGLLEERKEDGVDKNRVNNYITGKYKQCLKVFTDASKNTDKRVGVAYVIPELDLAMSSRINNDLAVYTAELVAIWLALLWLDSNRYMQAVIASDSSSALTSIKNSQSETREDLLIEILQLANGLQAAGSKVTFLWVPAHIGVEGNELADEHAKKATGKNNIDMDVKYSKAEVKSIVKAKTITKWQHIWDNGCTGRHLYRIQGKVGKVIHTTRSRQEENVLTRMRLGHTKLNSTMYLMKKHVDGN